MTPSKTDVADERRQQIQEAALRCFARKGYDRTTMDDIAQESGLSKGAIYWYFKSKRDLSIAIFMDIMQGSEEGMAEVLADPALPVREKLRLVGRATVEMMEQDPALVPVMLDFWATTIHDEQTEELMRQVYETYMAMIGDLVQAGIERGEFRPVNAAHVSAFVMAGLDGLMMVKHLGVGEFDWSATVDTFVDVLVDGLRPRTGEEPT
ncbi:MAG: TetR/AcrR family transcriptional regulator [Chloroflexi bacterium]|nr:TetR/AcrR family transcriptional regulator [Chloroflexota bacterium]MBU1751961.1 TetR/AcrR family transcriptional regulator [Chloroflexota bacterium]MBU1878553.1 TetR/AcrR family transcriptional regulator [Chloroflexota bacterium]